MVGNRFLGFVLACKYSFPELWFDYLLHTPCTGPFVIAYIVRWEFRQGEKNTRRVIILHSDHFGCGQ